GAPTPLSRTHLGQLCHRSGSTSEDRRAMTDRGSVRASVRRRSGPALGLLHAMVQVEEAFKNLKGDLALRPIFHQLEHRIEAHILVSLLAYCVHVSLREKARRLAPGLTTRSLLEKFGPIQMLDVHFPT